MDPTYMAEREHFISQANKNLEDGLFDAAIALADERLARYPGDTDASIVRATALVRTGKLREAWEILNQLDGMIQEWSQIYELLGFVYRKQGVHDEAIKAYKKFIALNPDSPMKRHISNKIEQLKDEVKEEEAAAKKPSEEAKATEIILEEVPVAKEEDHIAPMTSEPPPDGQEEAAEAEVTTEKTAPEGGETPHNPELMAVSDNDEDAKPDGEEEEIEAKKERSLEKSDTPPEETAPQGGETPQTPELMAVSDNDEDAKPDEAEEGIEAHRERSLEKSDTPGKLELVMEDGVEEEEEHTPHSVPTDFDTVTLAELYFQQGYDEMAQDVLNRILVKDPGNEEAREKLKQIGAIGDNKWAPVIDTLNVWLNNLQRTEPS